jgi:hypothetical protein
MALTRKKTKGRGGSPPFFQLYHTLLDSPRYINLSHPAKSLLIDIVRQYNGRNNGDLCVTLNVMKKRGWNSNSVMRRALNGLRAAELVLLTRQGSINKCSLYALSWLAIDECGGKLEVASTRTPPLALSWTKPHPNLTQTLPKHYPNTN